MKIPTFTVSSSRCPWSRTTRSTRTWSRMPCLPTRTLMGKLSLICTSELQLWLCILFQQFEHRERGSRCRRGPQRLSAVHAERLHGADPAHGHSDRWLQRGHHRPQQDRRHTDGRAAQVGGRHRHGVPLQDQESEHDGKVGGLKWFELETIMILLWNWLFFFDWLR